jgi:hypothetical protein
VSKEYPFIPPHLEKALEDISIPLIDLMHGHLKVEMLDCEEELNNLSETQDVPRYNYVQGYMQALTNLYCLTYNLTIDRQQIERDHHHAKLGI